MGFWSKLLWLLVSVGLIFWLFTMIRHTPQSFSRENMSKSIFTLGILALFLIGFIALSVVFVRHGM